MYKLIEEENKIITHSIKWDLTKEDKVRILTHLNFNKTYSRVFNPRFDLTKDTEAYIIEYGRKRNDHAIITIAGRTGSGKSSTGLMMLCRIHGDKATIDQIAFSHSEQKKILKNIGKNNTIMRDEQTLRVGVGSKAEELEIKNWDETLRKDGINLIYIAPTERYHGTAHKNLEFVCMNKRKRLSLFALYQGSEKRKFYTGFCIFKIPRAKDWKNKIWQKYNRKKDKFNKATREDSHSINWKDFIDEIKEHKDWKPSINYNDLEFIIFDLFNTQPFELRKAIFKAYLSKVGINTKRKKIPKKPAKCKFCNSKHLQYYPSEGAWKCRKCSNLVI